MTVWVNTETGETAEGDCPHCEEVRRDAEIQIHRMEMERRTDRSARTKAEGALERAQTTKRDGAVWARILKAYQEAFPDKRLSAKGLHTARATAVFQRLESLTEGDPVQDFIDAIVGAKQYPYRVYGQRVANGSRTDLADDLQHIAALNRDHEFETLRDVGRMVRGA